MNISTGEAIILRFTKYGDYDGIVEFFCSERGKISVMAKGIQKEKSKNKGSMRLFSHIQYEIFLPKSSSGMGKLVRMNPITAFLEEKIFPQTIFSLCSEITSSFLQPAEKSEEIFALWIELIQEQKNVKDILFIGFFCRFFSILGLFPHCTHCMHSDKKFTPQEFFYWEIEGGIFDISPENFQENKFENHLKEYKKISFELLKIFAFAKKYPMKDTQKIFLSSSQKKECFDILWWFYSHHQKFFPRSKKIFESLS